MDSTGFARMPPIFRDWHRWQIEREPINSSVPPDLADWVVCDHRRLDEVNSRGRSTAHYEKNSVNSALEKL